MRGGLAVVLASALLAGCGASGPPATRPYSSAADTTTSRTAAPPSRPHARHSPPNIVFVLTDDLAWNLVRYMPHVQDMRARGVTFSNYFVTDSLCCPSRSSIFTGRLPHNTGVFTNNPPDGGFQRFHDNGGETSTFATALQSNGYRTALLGKYLNGYLPADTLGGPRPYVPPGWSEWDVAGWGYPEYHYQLNENGTVVPYHRRPSDYLTDVIARKGVEFIRRSAREGKPFLLELATFAPHHPYTPAPRDTSAFPGLRAPRTPAFGAANVNAPSWLASHSRLTRPEVRNIDHAFRLRAQSVRAVDRMIADVEAALKAAGVADNTYIVFSSDNGLHMGDHRLLPGKLTAFDTDIRVPLIVTGPQVSRGRTVGKLAENVDLAPTFTQLARASMPVPADGRSLVPLLSGERAAGGWRNAALVEHRGPNHAPRDPDQPETGAGDPISYEAMRTSQALYVEYVDGETEYYDLARDPYELVNRAGELSQAERARLHAALVALESCHGDACWAAAAR